MPNQLELAICHSIHVVIRKEVLGANFHEQEFKQWHRMWCVWYWQYCVLKSQKGKKKQESVSHFLQHCHPSYALWCEWFSEEEQSVLQLVRVTQHDVEFVTLGERRQNNSDTLVFCQDVMRNHAYCDGCRPLLYTTTINCCVSHPFFFPVPCAFTSCSIADIV